MNSTAELASHNGEARVAVDRYRAAVKATMNKREPALGGGWERVDPSEEEVGRFLMEAAIYGLEPLAGQIYASWDDGVMRAVTNIDGLRLLAERTEKYDGQDDPEWCDKEGNWTDYWSGADHPLAARVRVHKKDTKAPTTGTANWHDFAPKTEEGSGSLWSMVGGKPAHMLSIRAEALALRKAFPAELSGLYTAEELGISFGSGEPKAPGAGAPAPSAALTPIVRGAPSSRGGEQPDAVVDRPPGQNEVPAAPARPRTLAEMLESGDYDKLRDDLVAALFDRSPARLDEQQRQRLVVVLGEAEEAAITPVELERMCKVALRASDVAARGTVLTEWVQERRRRADGHADAEPEPSSE
jgi:RecT family